MAKKSTQHYLRRTNINDKLLSSIDSGMIILNSELIIHSFNHWLEIHTLMKEDDLLGKPIGDVFENINLKTLKRKVKTALKMGTPSFYTASVSKYLIPIKINQINVYDFEHMRQDVSIIPFDVEKNLVVLIITDQTNITNTNTLLNANILKIEELNAELLKERDTIDKKVLLIKFDKYCRIHDASHAYLNLLKFSKDQVVGQNFFTHISLDINQELQKNIQNTMLEQKVFTFENTILDAEGKEFTLSCSLVPEYNPYAKHIGFMLFMENITASIKLISQQEKLLITSRSAAMGEMISMIAHQWRQPLTVVSTILGALRIKQELQILNAKTLDNSFTKIEETILYLSQTIDDFRNYFKPNKVLQDVLLIDILEKSTTFLTSEMKFLHIDYSVEIDSNLRIQTYQNELVQCLINIVKNSVDAFRENETIEKKSLTLHVTQTDEYISLNFNDNAGGIDKEVLQKVYEPYFSTKAKNGTGLGLYMTKNIIEDHLKGKITTTSKNSQTNTLIELPHTIKNQQKETK